MMKKKALTADDIFGLQAEFCSIFQNAKRLKILWCLSQGEKAVTQISEEVNVSLSNVSQHLRIMKDRRIITARKEGQKIYYRITNEKFIQGPTLVRQGVTEVYGLNPEEVKKALTRPVEIQAD